MPTSSQNDPWIRIVQPQITLPSLKDNTGDADRLMKGLRKSLETTEICIPLELLRQLPATLRNCRYGVGVVLYKNRTSWDILDILPSDRPQRIFGLAVDLGSSTVATRLIDLGEGAVVDETSFHNPQIRIASDILSRIHYAAQEGGLGNLQALVRDRLNQEIQALCSRHGIAPRSVAGMAIAGNTTMTHLFLGLDPYWICREPYIPVINKLDLLKAKDVGLTLNQEAPILVFPNIGSYFGGDLIAGILASGMTKSSEVSILVDVGTNAEVVIGNSDWLMGCAGAAGPALEGGVAGMGMMAGPGVIDKVSIDPDTGVFTIRTIAHQPPVGICGSGLIDLVGQLFLSGMIDLRAKFVPARCGERLVEEDGVRHLIVVHPEDSGTGKALTLSQPDIDALIRSKAAMYTILTTISNTVNVPLTDLRRFYVAGTFGSYIDPRSAITIGMIPDLPIETYVPLGNTSLAGAALGLLSLEAREEAFRIRNRITYLELNVNQEFMNLFSAAKFLPHTDRSLFPSVKPIT